jgi:hypothetical protein
MKRPSIAPALSRILTSIAAIAAVSVIFAAKAMDADSVIVAGSERVATLDED